VTVTAGARKAGVDRTTPHNWVNFLRCHGPPVPVSLVAGLRRTTAAMTSWS
jgi:transposase-like protein